MEIVIKLSQFLLSLSLLIILHELGHFIPAKLFKTRVEKFYLFFDINFSLLKKKIGETEYGIGWLPLGGYVKISGMIDESMDKEQMALPPQPWEFRSKPAWQRLIIMLGGVTVNFILAFIIYIGMTFFYGEMYIKNSEAKDGVWISNPVVEKYGLKTGDKIISVDGVKIDRFDQVNEKVLLGKDVTVERNGAIQEIHLPVDFSGHLIEGRKTSIIELRVPFVVSGVEEDSPNKNSVQPKDIVINFNGKPIKYADELLAMVDGLKNQRIPAIVKREGREVPIMVKVNEKGKMGIGYAGRMPYDNLEKLGLYHVSKQQFGFFESFPIGITKEKTNW